jgi:hypothetical protein
VISVTVAGAYSRDNIVVGVERVWIGIAIGCALLFPFPAIVYWREGDYVSSALFMGCIAGFWYLTLINKIKLTRDTVTLRCLKYRLGLTRWTMNLTDIKEVFLCRLGDFQRLHPELLELPNFSELKMRLNATQYKEVISLNPLIVICSHKHENSRFINPVIFDKQGLRALIDRFQDIGISVTGDNKILSIG